jgi:hypothetical protein
LARGRPITQLQETSLRVRQLCHVVVEAFVCVGDRNFLLGGPQHGEKIGNLVVAPAVVVDRDRTPKILLIFLPPAPQSEFEFPVLRGVSTKLECLIFNQKWMPI